MTYLSGRSRSRRKYLNIALGVCAFALFVYLWPQWKSVVRPLTEPLVHGYGATETTASFFTSFVSTYFTSHTTSVNDSANMQLEIERLENQLAQRDAFIRESGLMQEGQVSSSTPVIMMYPIAEDITRLYSSILLSKGYKNGIEKGGLVYVRGMQPVCIISDVYDTTSLCELLSKGDRAIEGVTSSSTVTLSLVGQGGGNFVADIPKDTKVSVGESVYLRSNQSYTLGTVVSAKEDEQATGAHIYVRGAYNPVTSSVFYLDAKYIP
jgi:hypothetical protein